MYIHYQVLKSLGSSLQTLFEEGSIQSYIKLQAERRAIRLKELDDQQCNTRVECPSAL